MNAIVKKFSKTNSILRIYNCFIHSNAVSKSDLSKLRKSSGFTFTKCKEALIQHDGNLEAAHEWLKQEAVKHGWSKMGKLSERPMSNGLIGFLHKDDCSILLEINCETDFVARNNKFHKLLNMATNACVDAYSQNLEDRTQHFDADNLKKIVYNGDSLENHIASAIGSLGENMLLRRAVILRKFAADDFLTSYLHFPWSDISRGFEEIGFAKYAAIMRYRRKSIPNTEESLDDWFARTEPISRTICQHIVAMSPKRIGKVHDEEDILNLDKIKNAPEDRLLFQEYIIDEMKKIHEISEPNDLDIRDFVRYECGHE